MVSTQRVHSAANRSRVSVAGVDPAMVLVMMRMSFRCCACSRCATVPSIGALLVVLTGVQIGVQVRGGGFMASDQGIRGLGCKGCSFL